MKKVDITEENKTNLNPCETCTLKQGIKVLGCGPIDAEIVFLGEVPEESDIRKGEPFAGDSAVQVLNPTLRAVGLDREKIYMTNACLCRPVLNRVPTKEEILLCRNRLMKTLKRISPKLIVTLGNVPLYAMFPKMLRTIGGVQKYRGRVMICEELNCKVLPTFHPGAIARNPGLYKQFRMDIKKAAELVSGVESVAEVINYDYTHIQTVEQFKEALIILKKEKLISFDIETTGLDCFSDDILCMSLCYKEKQGFFFLTDKHPKNTWKTEDWWEILSGLKSLFEDPEVKPIVHNESFEAAFVRTMLGINFDAYADTLIMHFLLDENSFHGLKDLAKRYPDVAGYEEEVERGKMLLLPVDKLMKYNCIDSDVTFRLFKEFSAGLDKIGLTKFFYEFIMPFRKTLTKMEMRGVNVDQVMLKGLVLDFGHKIEKIEKEIFEISGKELNLRSSKQIQALLYTDMGLAITEKTAKGAPKTDKKTLSSFPKSNKVIQLLLMHKKLSKLLSTYIIGVEKRINPITHKVHTDFLVHGAVTGRLSSRNPNLQNIPRGDDEYGRMIKNMFVPCKPGWKLILPDYKQLEYRIMLQYVGDEKLINDLRLGFDPHAETAAEIFGIPKEQVTKKQRVLAKGVVFGLLYGRGPASIAEEFGWSYKETIAFIERFFELHSAVKKWMNGQIMKVRKDKQVVGLFGRIRRLPNIDSSIPGIVAEAERQAINSPIQGVASDICGMAAIRVWNRLEAEKFQARPIMIIHDSIPTEAPNEEVDQVISLMCEEMKKQPEGIIVPLDIDFEVGNRWGEAEKVEFQYPQMSYSMLSK
jgi:DNA polymerase-1